MAALSAGCRQFVRLSFTRK